MTDLLKVEIEGNLAIVFFNRPHVYNSFNKELALGLQKLLNEFSSAETVRAIILTGIGRAFCAGQDLEEATEENGLGIKQIVDEHYNPLIRQIRDLPKPVVAAVNGVAAGAGANIALACDVVVAAESASFIQAFSKIGLVPDSGGSFTLPRIVGFAKASAYMMLGDKVDATEAERVGMIYKTLPDSSFLVEAEKIGQQLARLPTKGLALTKELLNQSFSNALGEQLELEKELQHKATLTKDHIEGVKAFMEKRTPKFTGK